MSPGNASKYEFLTGKDFLSKKNLLEKAAALKRFEHSPLRKAFEKCKAFVINKQTEVINEKEEERNKLLKTIIRIDKKYRQKVRNALLYLPKEQVEIYVKIAKSSNPEDLEYGKHNFNRYGTTISISIFLTKLLILMRCTKCLMGLTMKSIN